MAQEPTKITRRQVIKLLTATTGAATLANLPHKWVKPIVQAGVLPAHAQTSPTATATSTSTPTATSTSTPTATSTSTPTATSTSTPTATSTSTPTATSTSTPTATATQGLIQGLLEITLGWGAEVGQMNLDLEVYDPGSAQRCTPTNTPTFSLAHQGDSGLGGSGSENVVSGAGVVAGTYGVYLRVISTSFSENFLMFADIDVTAISVNLSQQPVQFDRFGNFSGNSHCRYYVHEPLENSIHRLERFMKKQVKMGLQKTMNEFVGPLETKFVDRAVCFLRC